MKQLLTFSFLLLTIGLFAQPANDDCAGIIDLGVAPSCDSTLYNNIGATQSDIGFDNFNTCFVGVPDRDVWFQFTATADFLDYRIEVTGCEDTNLNIPAMSNPQIAIYRGDCVFNGLQLLDCVTAGNGELSVLMDLIGLTPNITYYLRINDWSSTGTPNDGAFKLCVREKPPVSVINQGGSTECSGTLTDTGGEFGDYGNNEDFVFTICPSQPHECILFNMQYYNLEFGIDSIIFYDGDNAITAPTIGAIASNGSPTPNYGGVCYSVSASSGCLTVQFKSDNSGTFEGFLGTWECTSEACPEIAELEIDAEASPDEIIGSVISGQTLISVVDVDCANGQVGTFAITDDTDLGMDKGLVLSSGSVQNIANPAIVQSNGQYGGLQQTDADLEYLSNLFNGSETQDACIVTLDVLAASEELTFEYVFGSEEYPVFINGAYNDIFALLVSGPGITGDPNISNQENVSTLPDGTFIQINSVNHNNNWQYYRDNSLSQNIVYNGLTSDTLGVKKSLTAIVPTQACETYKLKFAIADREDNIFDSGVFISKINTGTPELSVDFQSGIDYLVESCTNIADQVVISFGNLINNPQTYQIKVEGNAILGTDYLLNMPDSVVFETGTEIFTFPITVLPDTLVEGIDTVEISLIRDFGCGQLVVSTIILEIHDNLTVEVLNVEQDTAILCASVDCISLEVTGAQEYAWSPDSLFDDASSAIPMICTDVSQWIYVQGTLGLCNDIDSIFINVIDVEVNILPNVANIDLCEGETLTVLAENNVNNENLQWNSFFTNFTDPTNPEQVISDQSGIGFESATVTVTVGGCAATDNITVTWVPFEIPQLINDVTICQNSSVQLAEELASFTTTYEWTPDLNLSPSADVSGPLATPEETTTYTLISTAGSTGNTCADTASVTITVIPADIDFDQGDTTFICVGETATLTNTHTDNVVSITWSPTDFLTEISPEEAQVNPPVSQYYYVELETPDCIVYDSIWVQVDSLPDLAIMADPAKDSYCQGEEVLLFSTTYEPANFSAIEFEWADNLPGVQTPDSFLNLVFLAVETFTYTRTTTVNACKSVDSIEIKVVPVINISVVPSDTILCQGDQVQFTIDGPAELTEFTWMPPNGLSCSDCREPIATAFQTVTYQVEAEFDGCSVGASAVINVPNQLFNYSGPNPICPPNTVVTINDLSVPGATYSWTSSDGSLTSNDAQPMVSPNQTTTYFLMAMIDNCVLDTSLTIEVLTNSLLEVNFPDIACPGNLITIDATATPEPENIVFNWTNLNTGETFGGESIEVSLLSTTDFQVTSFDNCFTNTLDFTVNVSPQINVVISPPQDSVLAGTPSTFTANAAVAGVDYVWSEVPQNEIIGTNQSITVTNCATQFYEVLATDAFGCTSTAMATQFVQGAFSVNPPIIIGENGDTLFVEGNMMFADSIYEGEQVELVVDVDPPIPGSTYTWVVAGDTVAVTTDPSSSLFYLPEVGEDYQDAPFEVFVTSPAGCLDSADFNLTIYNNPVLMPNVFTPNGDQMNDNFTLVSLRPVEVLEFRIWNRWGKKVYDNENGLDGWDGMIDGKAAASDVYIYSIVYQIPGSDNPMKPLKGDVTLLR